MYRLIIESLLGLTLEVDKLRFVPCIPADWKSFKLHYRYRETVYHITVTQTVAADGDSGITIDGAAQTDNSISLLNDRAEHVVEVRLVR